MKDLLERYFAGRDDIAFAFLFGSQAKGAATARSDVDVAVYFAPDPRQPLEVEEQVRYPAEDSIWGDLERLLGREVELLVLNRAPADVAASALDGIPLSIRNWDLYLDFAAIATRTAVDFRETIVRDYRERNGLANRDQDTVD